MTDLLDLAVAISHWLILIAVVFVLFMGLLGLALGAIRWENGHNRPAPQWEVELVRVLFDGDALALYREPVTNGEAA